MTLLTDDDFAPEKSTTVKYENLRKTALKLSSQLPKYGKATNRVDQLIQINCSVIDRNLSYVDKATFVNLLVLLAAPKRLKIELLNGTGKNAVLVKQPAVKFINAPKHIVQQAAKKVREAQGTSRAERADVLIRRSHKKMIQKDKFYKDLTILLDDSQERIKIINILISKGIKVPN